MSSAFATDIREFIIANYLLGREDGLNNDASFMDEGIIDSTGILELVSHLEQTYGIVIPEEELTPDNLDSVDRIASYLARKIQPGTSIPSPEASSQQFNQLG